MNNVNPYASPRSKVEHLTTSIDGLNSLQFKQIKKYYAKSCNIRSTIALLFIPLIFFISASCNPHLATTILKPLDPIIQNTIQITFILITLFFAVTIIGLYRRTSLSRTLGIIACFLSLLIIPFGLITGAFGLYVLFSSSQIFGKTPLRHKDIKAEYKRQKINRRISKQEIKESFL